MASFYLQINSEGVITDAIDYPHENYVEVKTDILPVGVNGGWYKLINGVITEDVEKNPTTINNRVKAAIDEYTLSLIEGGII